jgi:membrane protease YdiL (CAAX protease family)
MSFINRRGFLLLELIVLFVIVPLLYLFDLIPVHKIIPLLILFGYCVAILMIEKPKNDQRWSVKGSWGLILSRFIALGILILLSIYFFTAGPITADLSTNRQLLFMILIYPLSSAFPQELIFREFFYHRYQVIFKNANLLLLANVVLFAFAHIYFANWTVLIFTLIGGFIFSYTYLKTKSVLITTVEHTLYGLLILSSGLADQFYKAF